jgi:hypothetical protein
MDEISIVPRREGTDVYLILDELSSLEGVWREPSDEANKQTVINMIAEGRFHRPMRIIVFNTDEGWSRDDTHDIGFELLDMSHEGIELTNAAREFIERSTGHAPKVIVR